MGWEISEHRAGPRNVSMIAKVIEIKSDHGGKADTRKALGEWESIGTA